MNIPKKIHFTYTSKDEINPLFADNIKKMESNHPDWETYFYAEKEIIDFILKYYGKKILHYYKKINPAYGPAKADFFRYLLMFKIGGVYLDIKSYSLRNLNEIINSNDKYLLSYWGKSHPNWGNNPLLNPGTFSPLS